MINLIKNELFKISKQKGYIILAIILILGFAVTPIISYFTTSITSDVSNIEQDYKVAVQDSKEKYISEYNRYLHQIQAESIKHFMDTYPEWKYKLYGTDYFVAYAKVKIYEAIKSGLVSEVSSAYYGLSEDEQIALYNESKKDLEELEKTIIEDSAYVYNLTLHNRTLDRLKQAETEYDQKKEEYESNKTEINLRYLELS